MISIKQINKDKSFTIKKIIPGYKTVNQAKNDTENQIKIFQDETK